MYVRYAVVEDKEVTADLLKFIFQVPLFDESCWDGQVGVVLVTTVLRLLSLVVEHEDGQRKCS